MASVQYGLDWLGAFMGKLNPILNAIVIFFLILFLGFLVGKIVGKLVERLLGDVKADAAIRRTFGITISLRRSVRALVSGVIYIGTVFLAFQALGLGLSALLLFLNLLLLILIIFILIGLKDFFANLAAGFTLRGRDEGAYLRMDDAEGTITHAGLTETIIETRSGDLIMIPNRLFSTSIVRILKRAPKKME